MSEDEKPPPKPKKEDVVFVHSPSPSGDGYRVLRKREDTLEVGEMRAVQEGRPIHGELVRLSPREGKDRLFDVEVLASREEMGQLPAQAGRDHAGPAQVATDAYRANWEAIFGAKDDKRLPN